MASNLLRAIAAGTAALGLVVMTTVSGQAHSKLVTSSPANGAVLATAPAAVSFTFDEPLLPGVDTISINDADGQNVSSTSVEPRGNTVSTNWPAGLPAGTYQVAYRIVSGDGHPVTGAITFSYGVAGSAPSAGVAPAESSSSGLAASLLLTIAVLAVIAIAGVLIVVLLRRGRTR
ncbi:MAG: copper resistance protein CopC [Candidatus Nanopelagicales bacterium]|nr:copper resistance protein CopC [Candidatus Nanopelagicales bacterium]